MARHSASPGRAPCCPRSRSWCTPSGPPGSPGSQLAPGLAPPGSELHVDTLLAGQAQEIGGREWVLYKPRWGGFYRTPLEELLRAHEVTTIVVAGCNFPNCPRTTVYEASERDFRVVLATDGVSGLYPLGAEELSAVGVALMSAAEVVAAL